MPRGLPSAGLRFPHPHLNPSLPLIPHASSDRMQRWTHPQGSKPGADVDVQKGGHTEALGSQPLLDWEIREAGLGAERRPAVRHTARHRVRQEPGPSAAVSQRQQLHHSSSQPLFSLLSSHRPPQALPSTVPSAPLLESSKPRGKPNSTAPRVMQARVLLSQHPADHQPVQTPPLPGRKTLRIVPLICPAGRSTAQLRLLAERNAVWELRFGDLSASAEEAG